MSRARPELRMSLDSYKVIGVLGQGNYQLTDSRYVWLGAACKKKRDERGVRHKENGGFLTEGA
jgi:hypothetical protein